MDWKALIASVAPTIGTALGGPFGGLAAKAALSALGIDAPAEDAEAKLERAAKDATPEQLLALRQADHEFRAQMRKLDVDLERIAQADRASARRMAEQRGIVPQVALSVAYSVAYGAVLWAYITGRVQVPADAQAQFSIVLGVLTAAQAQILNFWFGSSAGSKEKTAALAHR